MDETPSYMGGKGNSWRKLTLDGKLKNDFNPFPLELAQCIFTYDKHILVVIQLPFFLFTVLPRQTIFYDVVEYLYNKKLAPRLKEEIPKLLLRPNNEKTKLEHIRIISEIRYARHEICNFVTFLHKYTLYVHAFTDFFFDFRSPPPGNYVPKTASLHGDQGTSRRSRQARQRASRLRKLYGLENVRVHFCT